MTRPTTLLKRIEDAADSGGVLTFVDGDDADPVPWSQLHEEARGIAAALQSRGVGPGDRVSILGPTTRPLVTAIQAVWLCGATVVVLPLPMRLSSIDEFVAQTRSRIRTSRSTIVVADPDLLQFVEPQADDPPMVTLPELLEGHRAAAYVRPDEDPETLAVLQFTSGSTARPKGVMLPHRCVTANLDGIAEAARVEPDDVIVSWLPLYHDMGLIGTLTLPMSTGIGLVLAAPQDFLASPRRWMEWMSEFGATATAGPNFSYALAARALRRMDGLDLSRWRLALNGAEPVDVATIEAFCDAGARHGLDSNVVFPAFGMAEATLAVTFPEPGAGLEVDQVDRRALEHDRYAAPADSDEPDQTKRLALLGRPVPGIELRICDPQTGEELADRHVGEVEIRGTSVTPGYDGDPQATADAFHDGWLRTGDLGYLHEGRLAICGRIKDIIIVGGRNVFPEDAEQAAATVEGVRAGNVIAFGTSGRRGSEALVVIAETKAEDDDDTVRQVRDGVARSVRDAVGLAAKDVVLVRPGTLPKTSSGKLQRSLCRERYEGAGLEPVGA